MKRINIIGINIISVVVIILASSNSAVGYQTIQSTIQNKINKDDNQRELLFQTNVDLKNTKEIPQKIPKIQINKRDLLNQNEKFPTFNIPVIPINDIKTYLFQRM